MLWILHVTSVKVLHVKGAKYGEDRKDKKFIESHVLRQ